MDGGWCMYGSVWLLLGSFAFLSAFRLALDMHEVCGRCLCVRVCCIILALRVNAVSVSQSVSQGTRLDGLVWMDGTGGNRWQSVAISGNQWRSLVCRRGYI